MANGKSDERKERGSGIGAARSTNNAQIELIEEYLRRQGCENRDQRREAEAAAED